MDLREVNSFIFITQVIVFIDLHIVLDQLGNRDNGSPGQIVCVKRVAECDRTFRGTGTEVTCCCSNRYSTDRYRRSGFTVCKRSSDLIGLICPERVVADPIVESNGPRSGNVIIGITVQKLSYNMRNGIVIHRSQIDKLPFLCDHSLEGYQLIHGVCFCRQFTEFIGIIRKRALFISWRFSGILAVKPDPEAAVEHAFIHGVPG